MSTVLDFPVETEARLERLAKMLNRPKDAYVVAKISDSLPEWEREAKQLAGHGGFGTHRPLDVIDIGIANGTIYPPKRSMEEPFRPAKVDPELAKAALTEFEARL